MSGEPAKAQEHIVEPTVSAEHPSLLHYTNARGLFGILASQTLWATHFAYLNDRQEYRAAREILLEPVTAAVKAAIQAHIDEGNYNLPPLQSLDSLATAEGASILKSAFEAALLSGTPFVFSFCSHHVDEQSLANGLLSQWRGYGRDGGFAIEFDTAELEKLLQEDHASHSGYHFSAVIYGKNSPDLKYLKPDIDRIAAMGGNVVNNLVQDHWVRDQIDLAYLPFVTCATRVKDSAFKEENEVRFVYISPSGPIPEGRKPSKKICFREQRGEQVPYVVLFDDPKLRLPVRRIVIGPHPLAELRSNTVRLFLEQHRIPAEITISSIPYIPD